MNVWHQQKRWVFFFSLGPLQDTCVAQTTEDYASRSSIHGIGYVFDTSLGIVDRLFWLLVVVASVGVVVALTWNFWSQWRNEQVRVKHGSLTAVIGGYYPEEHS